MGRQAELNLRGGIVWYIISLSILLFSATVFGGQFSNQYSSPTVKCLLHMNSATGVGNVNEVSQSSVQLIGTATAVTGKFGNAIRTIKVGSNYYRVAFSSDCAVNRSDDNLLISFWLWYSTTSWASTNQEWIFCWRRNGGGIMGISLGDGSISANNNNLQYYVDTDGGSNDLKIGSTELTYETWYHIIWIYNRTSGTMQGFVNGVADYTPYTLVTAVDTRAPMDILFGYYVANSCLNGMQDEIVVMKKTGVAWTENEAIHHYKQARGIRGLR